MAPAADALREQALALEPDERVRLASDLLASLDGDPADRDEVERMWSQETARRMEQLNTGAARTLTRDEVFADLERLRAERSG